MMSELKSTRPDGRKFNQLRPVSIIKGINPYAEGSAEVNFGNTKLYVTASIETEVPGWLREQNRGWITAEYGMLPRSTHTRNKREAVSGKQQGRTLEIQRLIGRALRQAVELDTLGPVTIKIDCDVICADGGTRTAAITGAWVALSQAIENGKQRGIFAQEVELRKVAAVSVGICNGEARADLSYEEDSNADFDLNLVFTENNEVIEVQGTGEKKSISVDELNKLLALGGEVVQTLFSKQQQAASS